MNWLLLAVVAVIACFAWFGYRKGLVRVLFSFISSILALVLVSIISPFVGTFLQERTNMHEFVKEKGSAMVAELNIDQDYATTEERFAAIENSEIPEFIQTYLKSEHTEEDLGQEFIDFMGDKIADLVISLAAFVITFLVILLVFYIVSQVLNLVAKLPVLRSVNHAGGFLVGTLEGVLVVWIFFIVITFLCTTEFGKSCMQMIGNNRILGWLYNTNPLMRILL